MQQITIEDFIEVEVPKKIICCSLTKGYHWLRITKGHTPVAFREEIDFVLGEYEYLYIGTSDKDGILKAFDGTVKHLPFGSGK